MKNLIHRLKEIFLMLLVAGCQSRNVRSMIIDNNVRAEGNITKDTLYEGVIKFYDVRSNKLMQESYYTQGIENGERNDYYQNGKLAARSFLENGKRNGYSLFFDTTGELIAKDFFYYGIRTGNSSEYVGSSISDYWFYSLDNKLLFYISYDTLSKSKKITDMQKSFFFYNQRSYSDLTLNGLNSVAREYLIYTPNPPHYNFRYSLVLSDENYTKVEEVMKFSNDTPWSFFTLNDSLPTGKEKRYVLRLAVSDSIAGGDIVMYKILD